MRLADIIREGAAYQARTQLVCSAIGVVFIWSIYLSLHVWSSRLRHYIRHRFDLLSAQERTGVEAICASAGAYRAFAKRHPGWYTAIESINAFPHPDVQAAGDTLIDAITDLFHSFQPEYVDKLHLVRALRSVIYGFVSLELNGGFAINLDCDESFRRLITIFLAGLETISQSHSLPTLANTEINE